LRRNLRSLMTLTITLITCLSLTFNNIGYAITNGQPDGTAHPYVCIILAKIGENWYYGSGTLISPTIILTAGHLTYGATDVSIFFDPDPTVNPNWPFDGLTGTPVTHPEYSIGESPTLPDWISHDVGVIVLDIPYNLGVYGELPTEGLVDTLPMKSMVLQVGYGVQEMALYDEAPHGPPDWVNEFERMYAPAQLITSKHKWGDEFIKTTANPAKGKGGTAFGDSGGPIFIGTSETIIGVTSWGTNYPCAGVSYASRIDTADVLEFINYYL